MISLQFENVDSLFKELDKKVNGISELLTINTRTQINKAVFTITTKKFLKDFSVESALNPKKYFHVFEWGEVGNPKEKLFVVKRQLVSGPNMTIRLDFKKSRKPVPVPTGLQLPSNRRGRYVSKKSVFANKAEVMESGKPVTFTTKQAIVFFSGGDQNAHFVPARTVVNIMNPGGKGTTHSFMKFVEKWYATKVDQTIQSSGLFQNIQSAVTNSLENLGAGKNASKEAIRLVTEKYAQGVVEL